MKPHANDASGTSRTAAWALVARREVLVKLTDRAFLVSTVLVVGLITAFTIVQGVMSDRTKTYTVTASTPEAAQMVDAVRSHAGQIDGKVRITLGKASDDSAAKAAVKNEGADAWLHRDGGAWVLTSKKETPAALKTVVQQAVRDQVVGHNAAAAGTTISALESGATVKTALLQGDAGKAGLAKVTGFAFAFLFYVASLMFGITLANSVVEEKQSRIVEIIATAIPVRQLLTGKVLGNTVLAFTQMAVYVAVGMVGLSFTKFSGLLPALSGPIVWFLVFFVAGFVALACLWAVAGALASRSEDLQATTTPLTMLVMLILFGGMFLNGTAQTVVSFVPPLSAVLMPMRLLDGGLAWWEPVLALALLLGFAALTVRFGERIYRRSLLQTHGRVSLRQAWASAE